MGFFFFWRVSFVLVFVFGHAARHVGSYLGPLHWERGVLTTGPPGMYPRVIHYFYKIDLVFLSESSVFFMKSQV